MDVTKWIDIENSSKPGHTKAAEVRECVECGREKPRYPPSTTYGYDPHSFNRDDYCTYCHRETGTITKLKTLVPTPKTVKPTNPIHTSTQNMPKSRHISREISTDKRVNQPDRIARKLAEQQKQEAAKKRAEHDRLVAIKEAEQAEYLRSVERRKAEEKKRADRLARERRAREAKTRAKE